MKITWILLMGVSAALAFPTDFPEDEDHTLGLQIAQEAPLFEAPLSTGFPDSAETFALTPMDKQDFTTITQELILTSPMPQLEAEQTPPATTQKTTRTTSGNRSTPTRRKEERKQEITTAAAKTAPTKTGTAKQPTFATSPSATSRAASSAATQKNMFQSDGPSLERGKNENLSDFLKRKKQERFLATTEADPFAAFFSKATTTTRPSFREREETKEPAVTHSESFSSSGRSFSAPSKNRPSNRRNAAFGRSTQTASSPSTTTTTTKPTQTTKSRNRFTGFPRNSKSARAPTSTTPDTFVIDKPEPIIETSTRAKTFTKKPSPIRSVPNAISRRRDQTSTPPSTSDAGLETVAEAPADEVPKTTTRRGSTRRVKGNRL